MKQKLKKLVQKIKHFNVCKPLWLLFILVPVSFSFFVAKFADNDFWFLINTGRYILNHGFPVIEPFTIHQGLSFVVQQWLTDVIFFFIYDKVGFIGIMLLVISIYTLVLVLLYKICMLISNNKIKLSTIITIFVGFVFLFGFVRSRPQIFDYLFLLIEIYALEKYIKTKRKSYLFILPLISLLMINFHSSSWFMIFLFMFPYLIDSFKFRFLFFKGQGYQKKYLFITLIFMLIVGIINPYGIKAITYLFTSFGDSYINGSVIEMKKILSEVSLWSIIYVLIFIFTIFTNIKFWEKIKIRYLCLQMGTLLLGFLHIKGFSFTLIGGIFPFAFYYKDYFKEYVDNYIYSKKFKISYSIVLFFMFVIPISIVLVYGKIGFSFSYIENIYEYMEENVSREDNIIYTDYVIGSYAEWLGYRVYMDPRAEVFLKANNKKENIFYEYYYLINDKLSLKKFCNKYNFDYIIVKKDTKFNKYLLKNKKYVKVMEDISGEKEKYVLYKKIK